MNQKKKKKETEKALFEHLNEIERNRCEKVRKG